MFLGIIKEITLNPDFQVKKLEEEIYYILSSIKRSWKHTQEEWTT